MKEKDTSTIHVHYLIALLFAIAGLLVILIFVSLRTQADDATTQAEIDNQGPTVNNVTISTSSQGAAAASINLTELATTSVFVYGDFSDSNGCVDVTDNGGVSMQFFRSGVSGSLQHANMGVYPDLHEEYDPLSVYVASSVNSQLAGNATSTCSISDCSGGADTDADFECEVHVEFFADATDAGSAPDYTAEDWIAEVAVADDFNGTAANAGNASSTAEVNTLLALDLSSGSTIDYGSLSLGATSSPVTLEIRNSGNDNALDLQVYGTAMICNIGSIPTSSQRFSGTTSEDFADLDFALSGSSTDPNSLSTNYTKQQDHATPATDDMYWAVQIPATDVGGTCTGTNTLQAA